MLTDLYNLAMSTIIYYRTQFIYGNRREYEGSGKKGAQRGSRAGDTEMAGCSGSGKEGAQFGCFVLAARPYTTVAAYTRYVRGHDGARAYTPLRLYKHGADDKSRLDP